MDAASFPHNLPAVPGWRRFLSRFFRVVEVLAWALFFIAALTFIVLRYAILPQVESYRPQIESALSTGLGATVKIGRIDAGWDGLYPDLDLTDVRLYDRQGRPALSLPFVSLTVSWWSVPARQLRLHALEVIGANLDIRRTATGTLVIGGIELVEQADGSGLSDWILGQRRVVIAESKLRWNDEKRRAPELTLSNIRMVMENAGSRHRFGLVADAPRQLASRLDVRADLFGNSLSRLREWRGALYADLKYIDLAAWRAWVDYPADIRAGTGSVRSWLGFDGDHLEYFTADVGLDNAQARLGRDLPVLELTRVSGRVGLREIASGGKGLGFLKFGEKLVTGFEVSGRQVALTTNAGVTLSPADFSVKTLSARTNRPQEVDLEANSLDLEPLAKLIEHLPLDQQLRKLLTEFNPRGSIFDFHASWRGEFDKPVGYSARGRFAELALDARGPIPGFANLSGAVVATEKGGTLTLSSKNALFQLPQLFDEPALGLDILSAQVGWSYPNGRFEVRTDNAVFANQDAAGALQLLYRTEPDTPGFLELNAKLSRGVGARAQRYLPAHLKVTRAWLQSAIEKANVDEGVFHLKGNLADFPFDDPKRGSFRIALKVSDANFLYASGWPRVDNGRGELVFERSSVEFHGTASGIIGAAKLGRVDVRIAKLGAHPQVIEVQGAAEGPTQAFLEFIDHSPIDRMIDGFTETMRAVGTGKLNLKATLAIDETEKTRLSGQYQILNNDLRLDEDLPQLSKVNGTLVFTESTLSLRGVRGDALGGPFTLAGNTRGDGGINVTANGNFTIPGLRAWIPEPLLASASGGSAWRATINVRKRSADLAIESTLAGVAIDLPAPLGKVAADQLPLRLTKAPLAGTRNEDEVAVTLGRVLAARVQRRVEGADVRFLRGAVGIGDAAPVMPRAGLAVNLAARGLDVEQWKARLFDPRMPAAGGSASSPDALAPYLPLQANLRADTVDAFGKRLTQVKLGVTLEGANWAATLASQEANGTLTYQPGTGRDAGRLGARLKNLVIPASVARQEAREDSPLDRITQELPAVDIAIDAFEVGEKKLGKLELVASNAGSEWRIQRLNLANADGVLAGSGAWRARRTGEARRRLALDFTLEAYDAGKLLDRLGFPNTVRASAGRLEGNVAWEGSPLAIDYPSLSGNLSLRAEKGQFLKADPGVGKLLGIMSLQALPRRLALDFRDVFSEGFAFDLVSASSRIERGVLSTSDFKMTGVTAAVLMNGEVDLAKETQGLRVVVLPDLSGGMGSVVTALLGNPILGLATYLAQRVLKDPISKAFSFEYVISGTWNDPKIARIQTAQAGTGATTAPEAPAVAAKPPPARPAVEEVRK
jgi:uncharacterized protein (TIGR02099 family)